MKYLSAFAALALLPFAALAQSIVNTLPSMTAITFAPGSSTSTMTGQSVPGSRDLYYVQAKAGQTMSVSIASAATSVTFQVYNPDTTVARAADGSALVTGKTLPDAGGGNAQAWVGAIPRDGKYLITVDTGAGGPPAPTPYSLTVALQ